MEAATSRRSGTSRWQRLRGSLTRSEWVTVAGMAAVVVGLHVVGFFLLFAVVAPRHFDLGSGGVFGVGLGITAYTLGLRHAFDADHIGAIDNTTRKLMTDGQRPLSVGFFFSLGHSTHRLPAGDRLHDRHPGPERRGRDDGSSLHSATGLIGPTVSGTFLWIIGILNLLVLVSIVGIFRRMRGGHYDEAELEEQLDNRGFMNRFYKRATGAVEQALADVPARAACSASASTPRRRSRCSRWPGPRRRPGCRSTRSSACRSCSPPACRCWTRSTAPS